MNSKLLEVTKQAREQCLSKLEYNGEQSEENLLLGRCLSNSRMLQSVLQENGYDSQIGGGVLTPNNWIDHDTFKEAIESRTPIHYWVRVDRVTCEVASEADQYYGKPIAVELRPEKLGYKTFEDSYNGLHKNKL